MREEREEVAARDRTFVRVIAGLMVHAGFAHADPQGEEHQAEDNGIVIPTKAQLLNPPTGIVAPSVSVPTRIQNGRKVCLSNSSVVTQC